MAAAERAARVLGRYSLFDEIAAGGMAAVHLGRLLGPVGFSRTVAIKRLHAHYAKDPEFVSMFLDEARLAARIRHPNVVQTLDVVATDGELFLVMEYVQGDSLSRLLRASAAAGESVRVEFAAAIVTSALHGLHAAHEARGERGEPLDIVHRDVSPQNVLVGVDGVTRLLDFGVAKASGRVQTTKEGQIKGKLAYMSPEQVRGLKVDRRTDIYAAGAVLWEVLAGKRLYEGENDVVIFGKVLEGKPPPPSQFRKGVPAELDKIALRALSADPDDRYVTAREMAREIEKVVALVPAGDLGEWVERLAAESLSVRSRKIALIESATTGPVPFKPVPADGFDSEPATLVRLSQSNEFPVNADDLQDGAVPTQLTTATVTKPDLDIPLPNKRKLTVALAAFAFIAIAAAVVLRSSSRSSSIEPASAVDHESTAPNSATAPPAPSGKIAPTGPRDIVAPSVASSPPATAADVVDLEAPSATAAGVVRQAPSAKPTNQNAPPSQTHSPSAATNPVNQANPGNQANAPASKPAKAAQRLDRVLDSRK